MGTVKNIEFINITDLSMFLDVSVHTLYYWVQLKKIPYYKFGKQIRFSVEEINAWIDPRLVHSKVR